MRNGVQEMDPLTNFHHNTYYNTIRPFWPVRIYIYWEPLNTMLSKKQIYLVPIR